MTAPDINVFKNFHESLCKRFGYQHDPADWRRDLMSLEEHIAKLLRPEIIPDDVMTAAAKAWAAAKLCDQTDGCALEAMRGALSMGAVAAAKDAADTVPAVHQADLQLVITLRQAEALVEFFGGHDAEVTIIKSVDGKSLTAWCTECPEEGSIDLGPTEVDDELADKGRQAPARSAAITALFVLAKNLRSSAGHVQDPVQAAELIEKHLHEIVHSDALHDRDMGKLIDERDRRDEAIDKILDIVLGDDRPEWSSMYDLDNAVNDVDEKITAMNMRHYGDDTVISAALTNVKKFLVQLHKIGSMEVKHKIEACTGSWFVWGEDRDAPQAPPTPPAAFDEESLLMARELMRRLNFEGAQMQARCQVALIEAMKFGAAHKVQEPFIWRDGAKG